MLIYSYITGLLKLIMVILVIAACIKYLKSER